MIKPTVGMGLVDDSKSQLELQIMPAQIHVQQGFQNVPSTHTMGDDLPIAEPSLQTGWTVRGTPSRLLASATIMHTVAILTLTPASGSEMM